MEQQQAMLEYFQVKHCSSQWRDFLGALGEEFENQLDLPELRALMARIGERFAPRSALGTCETLDELEAEINRIWFGLDWGWVAITDHGDHLGIAHYCAPLLTGFGGRSAAWIPAFLEGVYQHWFSTLGIDPALRVREDAQINPDAGILAFKLAR
ncbi:MAG: cellulose biosynthesis protein BcsD [Janthinobacterium lividum]